MLTTIYNFLNIFYEKFANHIDYVISDEGKIVKVIKNRGLGSSAFIYFFISLVILITLFSGPLILINEYDSYYTDKIFLDKYEVQQICYENSSWIECFSFSDDKLLKLYLDSNNPIKTLYIKED